MTNEPMHAAMSFRVAERALGIRTATRVDPPTVDEPMIRCSVCGQQRRFEGFARVVILSNGSRGPQDCVEDMPLCKSCIDRPDVLVAIAHNCHPDTVHHS
jgi:hypothetical protein